MPEKKMHYFELHFQKILAATKGWKDDEFGAFVKLLIEQFDIGYIPDDPEELSRLITSYKKNWPRIKKKFTAPAEKGQLKNAFMETIRSDAHAKSAINSENGKKGGQAKKRSVSERLAAAEQTGKRNASQPVTSNQEPENTEPVVVRDTWFQMFRRVAGPHINDGELLVEIAKFHNRYPNQHANQSGALINTWVSRIGFKEQQELLPPVKKMVV